MTKKKHVLTIRIICIYKP